MNLFWTGIAAGAVVATAGAALLILRRAGWSLAEAVAGGLTTTLMLLSLVLQAAFMAGRPAVVQPVALGLVLLSGGFLIRRRRDLGAQASLVLSFGRTYLLAGGVILAALVALAAVAASGGPSRNLSRPGRDGFSLYRGQGPANHQVLAHLPGIDAHCAEAVVGIAGFAIIAAATYALARRYAWPPTAVTVTLVTISQPRLARLVTADSAELLAAAAGLFCLLALYRTVERPRFADLALLALGLSFSLCDVPLGAAFAPVLAVVSAVVLYRRHGGRLWWAMAVQRPALSAAVVAGCLVFGGVWRLWLPSAADAIQVYPLNEDAIIGATANLLRYLFESLDLGASLERLGRIVLEIGPAERIEVLYRHTVQPLFGQRGAAAPFGLIPGTALEGAWFGPPGLFLVLPAVLYALVRGPRRLKAVAVALAGYGYLATLIPAWIPGNASLFTRFFACGGFMVAFLLPPWRLTRAGNIAFQILCLLLLAVTLLEAVWWPG